MESFRNAFPNNSTDPKEAIFSNFLFKGFSSSSSSSSSSPPETSSLSSGVLMTRPQRQLVSIGTCSKLCAVCFVAGIFVGYTLKRRVRRWVSGLLRRLKDD